MSHIMASLHLLKERIFFFMCILNLVFLKTWFVSFFSPPPKLSLTLFFPQLVLFFLFLQRDKFFLTFVVLRGSCCSSQGELSLFPINLNCFVFSSFSISSYSIAYVFCLSSDWQSLLIRDKKGEKQLICGNPICFVQGELKLFLVGVDTMFLVLHY